MKITSVRIHSTESEHEARLRAYASIVLDHVLVINEIRVIQARRGLCVEFPKGSVSKKKHLETIAPLNCQTREYIESVVLKAYTEQKGT